MHENRDFVAPVNILTPFACVPFSWAARHTTMCLDDILMAFVCVGINAAGFGASRNGI